MGQIDKKLKNFILKYQDWLNSSIEKFLSQALIELTQQEFIDLVYMLQSSDIAIGFDIITNLDLNNNYL